MSAVQPRTYFVTFGALMALTALTTGAAFVNLGPANDLIMLAIAVTKAGLVTLFFMHLRWSRWLTRIFAGAAVLWLAVLIGMTLGDYLSRGWIPTRVR
jgi:cytochrome c oxidase subunit 4